MYRLERWQNERLSSKKLGGKIEEESPEVESSPNYDTTRQTVWLKFEAEKNPNDAAYQLIRLRRKLGLPIQIPIHGPDGKQALEKYFKKAENEQVSDSLEMDSRTKIFFSLF